MAVIDFSDELIQQRVKDYTELRSEENLGVYSDTHQCEIEDASISGFNEGIEVGFEDGYRQALTDLGIRQDSVYLPRLSRL